MARIEYFMRSSVLHAAKTAMKGKALSSKIRRKLRKKQIYFCVHLADGALVMSNGRFMGSSWRNRRVLLNEIREMMEYGKVRGMSRRQRTRKKNRPSVTQPWIFALTTKDIMNGYRGCNNDYEIGLLLRRYRITSKKRGLTTLGEELLQKIQTGEINEQRPNLSDLEGDCS
jgi:hypothetical protein